MQITADILLKWFWRIRNNELIQSCRRLSMRWKSSNYHAQPTAQLMRAFYWISDIDFFLFRSAIHFSHIFQHSNRCSPNCSMQHHRDEIIFLLTEMDCFVKYLCHFSVGWATEWAADSKNWKHVIQFFLILHSINFNNLLSLLNSQLARSQR